MTGGLRAEADTRIACDLIWAGDKLPALEPFSRACERGLAEVVFIIRSVLRVPVKINTGKRVAAPSINTSTEKKGTLPFY